MTDTIGALTAADLGAVIRLNDGGSVHEGQLRSVHHETGYSGGVPRTLVHLSAGEWRHIKTYPSDTAYVLAPSAPPPDHPHPPGRVAATTEEEQ